MRTFVFTLRGAHFCAAARTKCNDDLHTPGLVFRICTIVDVLSDEKTLFHIDFEGV